MNKKNKKGTLGEFDRKFLGDIDNEIKVPKINYVSREDIFECSKCSGVLNLVLPEKKLGNKYLYECESCGEREYKRGYKNA